MSTVAFALVAVATCGLAFGAQQPPAGDVARLEQRASTLAAFNTLTPDQKAAAWQRHLQRCLDTLQLSDEQRNVVKEFRATIKPENYRLSSAEQAEYERSTKSLQEKAITTLGKQLFVEVFRLGPSLAEIEAARQMVPATPLK